MRDSRVLVFSQRHLAREVWHAAQFEFEDVLEEIDDVVVLSPEPQSRSQPGAALRQVTNEASRRAGIARRSPHWRSPSMRPTKVHTNHDVFFGIFHHPHQLAYLQRLAGWRERSKRAVCLIVELWSPGVGLSADYLQVLKEFDEVYVANPRVAATLHRELGIAPAKYLFMGVDALVMAPMPHLPDRIVDVYSYGRRSDVTHRALLDLVETTGLTYVYDSLTEALLRDHKEHRLLIANLMKRSRFFLAHRINDSPERRAYTGGDESLSTRYYEAAAGGAVILGSRPQAAEFDVDFPWDDAVISLPWDSTEVGGALADLVRQTERLAAIRANNVKGSLQRHDWSHRWREILRALDMCPLPAAQRRLDTLALMADRVTPELFLPNAPRP